MRAEASRGKTPERGAGVEGLPRVIAERSKDSFLRAGALLLLAALLAAAPDPWQVCCLIVKHDFIDPWTRIPRFTGRWSVLALSIPTSPGRPSSPIFQDLIFGTHRWFDAGQANGIPDAELRVQFPERG